MNTSLGGKSSLAGLGLTLVELLGDASLKKYAKTDTPFFLGVGVSSYMTLVYLLQRSLRSENLAIVNGYWDAYSNILTMLVAMAMGEHVTSVQIAGLLMIGGGLFLL